MSISYEEALATLQAMFPDPWTRESLDAILRHEKGHMENTCERIMQHGDADPQILVDRLRAGGPDPQVAMDEELARQLAAQGRGGGAGGGGGGSTRRGGTSGGASATGADPDTSAAPAVATTRKGRGTPTTLPDNFLRIPGYKQSTAAVANASANGATVMDDETLARMLQDELFSEELARNPQFAHLATGRSGGGRGGGRTSRSAASDARIPAGPNGPNPFEGVNVVQKISDMGQDARRRLQLFAANFEQRLNSNNQNNNMSAAAAVSSSLQEAHGAAAERRGLLDGDGDDEEDMIEFETRKKSD